MSGESRKQKGMMMSEKEMKKMMGSMKPMKPEMKGEMNKKMK